MQHQLTQHPCIQQLGSLAGSRRTSRISLIRPFGDFTERRISYNLASFEEFRVESDWLHFEVLRHSHDLLYSRRISVEVPRVTRTLAAVLSRSSS